MRPVTSQTEQVNNGGEGIDSSLEHLLRLYAFYEEDNRNYNNIVWQFPIALFAANGVVIGALDGKSPWIFVFIVILNYAFIHAIFKLCANQRSIIEALQSLEKKIKQIYSDAAISAVTPDFSKYHRGFLKLRSTDIICWFLFAANTGLLLVKILELLKIQL